MFVCNLKINKKKFTFIFTFLIIILASLLLFLAISKVFLLPQNDIITESSVLNIDSNNFTNFLKDCHENIDKYVGTQITITGYVYRMPDFNGNQFVLARTMLINSNNKAVVVGLLSESDKAKDFKDSDWVICTGTIKKGDYHGDMPILEVSNIEIGQDPEDEFVYSPSDFNSI